MKLFKKTTNILAGLGAMIIATLFISILFRYLFPPVDQGWPGFYEKPDYFRLFIMSCIMAPLSEELLFRHAPLQLLKHFIKKNESYELLTIPFVIITSMIFGWLHGSYYNVYIQGFGGLVLSWVYIKNGYSYWSSVILHSLWNFMCLLGFQILAQ